MFLSFLLLGACVLPGDDSGLPLPPCDCPNLIRVVESIEWVPGVTGRQSDASVLDDQSRRWVTLKFAAVEVTTEVQRLASALEDAGLPVAEDKALNGFTLQGSGYQLTVNEVDGALGVSVVLVNGTADEQAEEVLEPVINAIGSRS